MVLIIMEDLSSFSQENCLILVDIFIQSKILLRMPLIFLAHNLPDYWFHLYFVFVYLVTQHS